jgi:hypothetical protein
MAVYYIDPYTTVNGAGTWASPFSFGSTTRGVSVNPGDEFRIVAKYLTSILTATAYVASRSAVNTITITSGGGLGADFVVGDFVYFTDYDSFARVQAVSTNTLTVSTSATLPIPVSTSSLTVSLNVRKLNTAVATPSATGGTIYTWGDIAVNSWDGITVTDGWVADGVRVTDGTAKSLLRSTATSATANWYIDTQAGTSQNESPYRNSTANLPHTHYLGNNTTVTSMFLYCYALLTLNLNQIYGPQCLFNTSTTSSGSYTPKNLNFTFKHVSFSPSTGLLSIDSTLTVTNYYTTTGLVVFPNFYSGTANITYVLAASVVGSNTLAATATSAVGAYSTWNVGTIDIYNTPGPASALTGQLGGFTLNITNPILVGNGGVLTTTGYRWAATNSSINAAYPVMALPRINTTAITFTNSMSVTATFFSAPSTYFTWTGSEETPTVFALSCYHATTNKPNWYFASANLLVTQADGTAPYELLGVTGPVPNGIFGAGASQFPLVTTDATFFRTAGPSIKIYLGTIVTPGYWISGWATKNIKIPVVSGTSYTVAGYLRTDQTTFVSGNAVASIVNRYGTVVSQSMTTACINAWAGFSLSFTATQTEEVYLAIKVRFTEGVKSFWLDDLTIV